jgi:uncharacterized coiled-coil DUF342 family protein
VPAQQNLTEEDSFMTEAKLETRLGRMAEELQEDATKLREKLKEIDQERSAVQKELDRIEDVIATIRGRRAKGKTGGTSGPRGTGFTKNEVIQEITEIIRKEGPLEKDELKRQVLERARANGKTWKGLPVLLKHALKSDRFAHTAGRYELAK